MISVDRRFFEKKQLKYGLQINKSLSKPPSMMKVYLRHIRNKKMSTEWNTRTGLNERFSSEILSGDKKKKNKTKQHENHSDFRCDVKRRSERRHRCSQPSRKARKVAAVPLTSFSLDDFDDLTLYCDVQLDVADVTMLQTS